MNDYTPDWYPKESPKPTTPEPVSAEVVSAETVSTEGLSAGTELVPLKQALYTAPRDSRTVSYTHLTLPTIYSV